MAVFTELMEMPVAGSLAVTTDCDGSPMALIQPAISSLLDGGFLLNLKLVTVWAESRVMPKANDKSQKSLFIQFI